MLKKPGHTRTYRVCPGFFMHESIKKGENKSLGWILHIEGS